MKPASRWRTPSTMPLRSVAGLFLIGFAVALNVAWFSREQAGALAAFDNALLDTLVKYSASGRTADHTVVIDIDDVSLSALGQWPWPRYRIGALIERVVDAKPAAVGLDIFFPEPDRSSLDSIRATFKRDFDVDVAISGVPQGLLDNDGYLGDVIGRNGVVGSNYLYFDHFNRTSVDARNGVVFDGRLDLPLQSATGILSNIDAIASQTRMTGFVNNRIGEDGRLRKLPLLIREGKTIHAHLSLVTVMRALGVASATLESDWLGSSIRVADKRIPIDEAGFTTLRFNGDQSRYRSISALDILNDRFRPEDLAGKIVFIGSSAVGLNDIHNTSVDPRFPGLKVQSVTAENILEGVSVRIPSWTSKAMLFECVVVAALMAAMFVAVSGVYVAFVGTTLLVAALLLVGVLPYVIAGIFVSPGPAIVTVCLLFVLFFVTRFVIEKRRALVWRRQLENARQVTIESMASVAETRDPETGAHIKRTQHYVKAVAQRLRETGHHLELLTPEYIDLLFISAPLHDIGKVGVPDHILLKPGKLTPEEMVLMRKHAGYGRDIITSSSKRIDGDNFLVLAGEIAATHHEKWDGTGYPLGLKGEDIPLSGRIMAVADIYDALISRRCYKEPFSHAKATDYMREMRGTTFDPVVLDAFFEIEDAIKAIAETYRDEAEAEHLSGDSTSPMAELPEPLRI